MARFLRLVLPTALLVGMAGWSSPVQANHPAADHQNMNQLFESPTGATNSDLAFWGDLAVAGNYGGFRIFDISNPAVPSLVVDFPCDGPQNDVSVWDRDGDGEADILFLSVDSVMEDDPCGAPRVVEPKRSFGPYDADDWEGIRVFDISNPAAPVNLTNVYQDCGSHTHTMVPDPDNSRVLLYNSSYSLRSGPTCGPGFGADPAHGKIQVVEVAWNPANPLNPATTVAVEIAEPPINYPGDPDNVFDPCVHGGVLCEPLFHPLRACHDLAVYMPDLLVGAACAEQAQLWRINPVTLLPDTINPVWVFDNVEDTDGPGGGDAAVDFWHSATFTWDGKIVNFSDESFGDGCPPTTDNQDPAASPANRGPSDTGRTYFLRTSSGAFLSDFMIPRPEPGAYCSTHQGNTVPVPGKNLLIQAWYMGGVDIVDFTAVKKPKEIAYFDFNPDGATGSDNWAHYWYENDPRKGSDKSLITYGQDGVHNPPTGRGFQVFEAFVTGLGPRPGLDHLNPQTQE